MRKLRFSLATILFLMLCLGGYLAGHKQGFQAGKKVWDIIPVHAMVYLASDLLDSETELDDIVAGITSEVVPECWDSEGGNCSVKPFAKNNSLVVQANAYVHEQVVEHLQSLRAEKVASLPQVGVPTTP